VVTPIPAAHETLERDTRGHHRYLGYVMRLPEATIYHSGDCIPYPGLSDALAAHRIDVALLPVNGRDAFRASHGMPGNFTLAEAAALCREQSIPTMIAHHFGMFEFNTIAREDIEAEAESAAGTTTIFAAALQMRYVLDSDHTAALPARSQLMVDG
jgi:L-ascorbate metabolism protein UlaG (beta-lactamase superfamily)